MEYFTLAEDLDEIQSSRAKTRNRIFIALIIVVLFFLLRSLEVLNIEIFNAYTTGSHQIRKEIYEVYDDGKTGTINQNNKKADVKTDDKDSYRSLGIYFKGGNTSQDEKEYLEKLIRERLFKEKTLSKQFEFAAISVEKLELSGGYWLPLIKNGGNSYRVSVQNQVYQNTYSADFSGEIDLEVYGFCTISKLEETLADKIAKIIVDSIKEDYKK